MTDDQYEGM